MKFILTIITILGFTTFSFAQPKDCFSPCNEIQKSEQDNRHKKYHPTKEEIMSQKVAFFTQELQLTPKEAANFWPVYNTEWDKIEKARKEIGKSLKMLNQAIKAEPAKSDEEINSLMNKYLEACSNEIKLQEQLFKELSKVVPISKAAKVFISEERFRIMLIKRLKKGENL